MLEKGETGKQKTQHLQVDQKTSRIINGQNAVGNFAPDTITVCLGKQAYPIVKLRKYSLVVSVTVESKHSTSSEERRFQRDLRNAHRREEKNIYTIFAKCKVIEKMEKEILVMFKRFVLFYC